MSRFRACPKGQVKAAQYLLHHLTDLEAWKELEKVTGDTGSFEKGVHRCNDPMFPEGPRGKSIYCDHCPLNLVLTGRFDNGHYLCRYKHPNYTRFTLSDGEITLKLLEFIAYVQATFPNA